MRNPYRGIGGIDALTAGTGGAKDVYAEILVTQLYLGLLDFRKYCHADRRGVDAPAGFGGGYSLNPVYAAFVLQIAEDVFTRDREDDLLEAADFAWAGGHKLDLPAVFLGIATVHPIQIRREQRGLISTGTGSDLHNGVVGVERVFGH